MKLAWNAIVKNERAVIERCAESLLPHIDCAVVVDTGSTDGTQQFLMQKFEMAGKPLKIYQREFHDFAQARNDALRLARESDLDWDYLLLSDADMDLVVEDPTWTKKLNGGPSYDVQQVAGTLVYWNRRLLSRSATGQYECPTHEFLNVPTAGMVKGIYFLDHADGSNRPEKHARDILLLEEALKTETRPGILERIHFYLAGSYFDAGEFQKALEHYKIRVGLMGGFEEERWYAQMRYAECLRHLDDQSGFLREMLAAYQMRPQRAETLYELAKHFRERGDNHSSLLFSEAGMQMQPTHSDTLFVNGWAYDKGMKEEFAICAYYDERKRSRGAKECNKLALAGSEQARSNMFWYLQPLGVHVPSFHFKAINFKAPDGYVPCNPSVVNYNGEPLVLVRTVNYTINGEGGYDIRDGDGACSDRNPICTRNFLTDSQHAIELQTHFPEPQYSLVRGFEDSRLFMWNNSLHAISTVRELNPEGRCEQVIAGVGDGRYTENLTIISLKERRNEKNWMPWVKHGELRFVYRLGHVIDFEGKDVCKFDCGFDVSRISGGSQVVQVDERTWLALVHEARFIPGRPNRYYQHRFVSFWPYGRVDRISAPFYFHDRQIEFCAGLAVFGKQLMVSYGVRDCEAWTATMDVDEVIKFIYKDAL